MVKREDGISVVRSWALDRIENTNGNYLTILYNEDRPENNGAYYPEKITYTYNDKSDSTLHNAAGTKTRSVFFNWSQPKEEWKGERRPDVYTSYKEGLKVRVERRLERIDVKVSDATIRSYDLIYDENSYHSLLTEIQEYGASTNPSSSSLKTKFSYSNTTLKKLGFNPPTTIGPIIGDTNEIVSTILIDMNGDSLPDAVTEFREIVEENWTRKYKVELNNGKGFNGSITIGPFIGDTKKKMSTKLIDMNGDSLPDAVTELREIQEGKWGKVYKVELNNGKGFGDPTTWSPVLKHLRGHEQPILLDMNGDSLPDAVTELREIQEGKWGKVYKVELNNGEGFNAPTTWSPVFKPRRGHKPTILLDMNGDSLPDAVTEFRKIDDDRQWRRYYKVELNNGRGFSDLTSVGPFIGDTNEIISTILIDMNGDSLPDAVTKLEEEHDGQKRWAYKIELNTGETFKTPFPREPVFKDGRLNRSAILLDINGDGLPDAVAEIRKLDDDRQWRRYYNVGLNSLKELGHPLSEITGPHGGRINFHYKPASEFIITDSSPKKHLPFPMWVVSRVTLDDGISDGGTSIYTYSYRGGWYDSKQREFRGFSKINENRPDNSQKITTYTNPTDNILWGQIKSEEIKKHKTDKDPLRRTEFKYEKKYSQLSDSDTFSALMGKTVSLFNAQSDSEITKEEYHYDMCGNRNRTKHWGHVEEGHEIEFDGDEFQTIIEYGKDLNKWIVDRPVHKVVQRFDKSGNLLPENDRESWMYYDENGNSERKHRWLDEVHWDGVLKKNVIITESKNYDEYGNVINSYEANCFLPLKVWDESIPNITPHQFVVKESQNWNPIPGKKFTTIIEYDPIYKTFPISVTNALRHVEKREYYGIYDVLTELLSLSEDDLNSMVSELDSTSKIPNQIKAKILDVRPSLSATEHQIKTKGEKWEIEEEANIYLIEIEKNKGFKIYEVPKKNLNQPSLTLKSVTDTNDQKTTYVYDGHSRISQIYKPLNGIPEVCDEDNFPTIQYKYFKKQGHVPEFRMTELLESVLSPVNTSSDCTGSRFQSIEYVDGFGRQVRLGREAATQGRWIFSDIQYDENGRKKAQFVEHGHTIIAPLEENLYDFKKHPYHEIKYQSKTLFQYDVLNRVVSISGPDKIEDGSAFKEVEKTFIDYDL